MFITCAICVGLVAFITVSVILYENAYDKHFEEVMKDPFKKW